MFDQLDGTIILLALISLGAIGMLRNPIGKAFEHSKANHDLALKVDELAHVLNNLGEDFDALRSSQAGLREELADTLERADKARRSARSSQQAAERARGQASAVQQQQEVVGQGPMGLTDDDRQWLNRQLAE